MKIATASLFFAAAFITTGFAAIPKEERLALHQQGLSSEVYHKITRRNKLSEADVIELSRKGSPNSAIIHYIYISKSYYSLSRSDVSRLERQGVSGDVVMFMVDNRPSNLLAAFFSF